MLKLTKTMIKRQIYQQGPKKNEQKWMEKDKKEPKEKKKHTKKSKNDQSRKTYPKCSLILSSKSSEIS